MKKLLTALCATSLLFGIAAGSMAQHDEKKAEKKPAAHKMDKMAAKKGGKMAAKKGGKKGGKMAAKKGEKKAEHGKM